MLKEYPELKLKILVVVEKDGDGYYAYSPALKGLHVGGDTHEEAFQNVVDGIQVYLESLMRHGDPLPIGPECQVEPIRRRPSRDATLKEIMLQWPSLKTSGINLKALPQTT